MLYFYAFIQITVSALRFIAILRSTCIYIFLRIYFEQFSGSEDGAEEGVCCHTAGGALIARYIVSDCVLDRKSDDC